LLVGVGCDELSDEFLLGFLERFEVLSGEYQYVRAFGFFYSWFFHTIQLCFRFQRIPA